MKTKIEFTKHALEEADKRNINVKIIEKIVKNPEQKIKTVNNRFICQELIEFENKKQYVVRVITEETETIIKIITLYKSSKISKYWGKNES